MNITEVNMVRLKNWIDEQETKRISVAVERDNCHEWKMLRLVAYCEKCGLYVTEGSKSTMITVCGSTGQHLARALASLNRTGVLVSEREPMFEGQEVAKLTW